ncbi:MAG TPA: DUF4433 domain-containing protein [Candidatus Binatia bacterium]|nr:DUF4433 domain-containing protein [Candidatus Binatia bacterium]
MSSPANPPIFHITHVNNLPGIIGAGRLWSDAQRLRKEVTVTNIGYSHIKQRRLQRLVSVAAGGVLGDYVPFNFCGRSVMLYVIYRGHVDYQGGQREIVHLVSNLATAVALGRPWAFTDRHGDLGYAQFYDDLAQLGQVSWGVMSEMYWTDVKEERQAEFLVHDWFPWTAVERIGVIDQMMAARVAQLMAPASHQPVVEVHPEWYY